MNKIGKGIKEMIGKVVREVIGKLKLKLEIQMEIYLKNKKNMILSRIECLLMLIGCLNKNKNLYKKFQKEIVVNEVLKINI